MAKSNGFSNFGLNVLVQGHDLTLFNTSIYKLIGVHKLCGMKLYLKKMLPYRLSKVRFLVAEKEKLILTKFFDKNCK